MLDALLPAVDSLRQGAAEGLSLPQLFSRAAEAAAQGAEATKQFQARYGRARNLGPRSVGHLDPGAVSISLLFAGFRDGLPACTPHAPREAGKTSRGA
jgi:dihydroxyacetone kinase-like protein